MARIPNHFSKPSGLLRLVASARSALVLGAAAAAVLLLLATFFNDPAGGARDFATRYAAGVALAHG